MPGEPARPARVDEWHGTHAYFRDGEHVFRTYFVDDSGDEAMGGTWSYPQTPRYRWWRLHDEDAGSGERA